MTLAWLGMFFDQSFQPSTCFPAGKLNQSFVQRWVQEVRKTTTIDLTGVPWPVNLLKCYRHTGEMQSGDEMVIRLKGEDVKESLVLILNAMPELSFEVSTMRHGFAIHVAKIRSHISAKDPDFSRGI